MDHVKHDRRARHTRELRKSIIKQRRNKRRLKTTQVNFLMMLWYCLNRRRVNNDLFENTHLRTRRNNKRDTLKNGVTINNRWVIPHNVDLVVKYQTYINVEWCNQGRNNFVIKENVSSNTVDESQSIREVDEIKRKKKKEKEKKLESRRKAAQQL
ncbi:hypothetical protein M9H77_32319 [Catharanthus roseus]|uniref:Uncharacterized protein n=1 Tax=Catharanthus roseus TaxID=4058 RepID=A0ACC0A3U2_CATRO|nr:hypothetical protein M9H77_32319 [Catharanthus roseus]